MSSVVIAAAPAVVGVSATPLVLVLLAGVIAAKAVDMIGSYLTDCENAVERAALIERCKEETRTSLLLMNDRISREMGREIDALSDEEKRAELKSRLDDVSARFRADIERGREEVPEAEFREIRQRFLSLQMDEKMAHRVEEEMVKVRNISLAGLAEDKYTLEQTPAKSKSSKITALLADIMGFIARVGHLDEDEAARLGLLIGDISSVGAAPDEFRLTAIREEVRMTYGRLRERRVMTELYREELSGTLPLVRRARGSESLILRMEELLTAREIPGGEYLPLRGEIRKLLAEQMEEVIDEAVVERARDVLAGMGYTLVGADSISVADVNLLESPYEGYRVKLKADKGGTLSTRLVRVVGSEDEKRSPGEYQRQKDIEVGRKWCADLDMFFEKMRSEGIDFKASLRKEPEEAPLDIVVEAGAGGGRRLASLERDHAGRLYKND